MDRNEVDVETIIVIPIHHTKDKPDEIALLGVDAETILLGPPGHLKVADRRRLKGLAENIARRLEVGNLQRLNAEAGLPEVAHTIKSHT